MMAHCPKLRTTEPAVQALLGELEEEQMHFEAGRIYVDFEMLFGPSVAVEAVVVTPVAVVEWMVQDVLQSSGTGAIVEVQEEVVVVVVVAAAAAAAVAVAVASSACGSEVVAFGSWMNLGTLFAAEEQQVHLRAPAPSSCS